MSLKKFLAAACLVLPIVPIAVTAAVPGGVIVDRKTFVPDARDVAQLRLIAGSRQFDEAAAKGLAQIMMAGGISPNEHDLLYELIAARTPVTIQVTVREFFEVPPPSAPARDFFNVVKVVAETNDLDPVLEARWLAGSRQMKELLDITTLGQAMNARVTAYILQKWTVSWMSSNEQNGFAPFKDDIAKYVTQLSQIDADTERRAKTLGFGVARDVDRRADNAIPDELYAALRP